MINFKQTSNTMKILAAAGFVVVIGLLLWLAVTLVNMVPSAFSSLASLAESIQQNRPAKSIIVTSGKGIVNNGNSITISWTDVGQDGVYTFAYSCTDGVTIEMRYPANNITTVPCGDTIKLGSDVTSLELIAYSDKKRFIDVDYTVGFIPKTSNDVTHSTDGIFTIVNALIPQGQKVGERNEDTNESVDTNASETTNTETETSVSPVATTPRVVTTEIYELPSSDPNGFVDLAIKYLGAGHLTDDNRFISSGTIDNDNRGAIRFEVRNLGTKTSDEWTYNATLPNGREYESKPQTGLLPNEYSVITIGFDLGNETGIKTFGAKVHVANDRVSSNNTFTWAVKVVD